MIQTGPGSPMFQGTAERLRANQTQERQPR
jgi:hypothetical protein